MKLSSGEIYFIGEYDVKTGIRSEYFKIGIVRHGGKDNRSSLDRLLEHQTGNPRRLEIVDRIVTDAVEAIETSIHHMFAPHRVYGEWLKLDEKLFKEVKAQAEQLKSDMASYRVIFEEVEQYQEVVSSEETNPVSDESDYWFNKVSKANLVIRSCEQSIEKYKAIRISDMEAGKDVDAFINVQQKAPRKKFDAKGFKEKYPDVYSRYCSITTKVRGTFRITTNKQKELDLLEVDFSLSQQLNEFEEMLSKSESLESQSELHNKFLGIQSNLAFAEWEKELAVTHLKKMCGLSQGIQGICTWKRLEVVEEKLDEKALREKFPDLAEEFTSFGTATKAYSLEAKSAYAD